MVRNVEAESRNAEKISNSVTAPGDVSPQGESTSNNGGVLKDMANAAGLSLGPISLSFGDDFSSKQDSKTPADTGAGMESDQRGESISSMTNEEWQQKYEVDGCVDLWMEEEFNAGSRLKVS